MNKEKPILQIYAQETYHAPAKIIGTRQGLQELAAALTQAAEGQQATLNTFPEDGEGYEITVTSMTEEELADAPEHYAQPGHPWAFDTNQAINPWLMVILRPALLALGVFAALYVLLELTGTG